MRDERNMSPLGRELFNLGADLSRIAIHPCDSKCRDVLEKVKPGERICFCECHPWNRPTTEGRRLTSAGIN